MVTREHIFEAIKTTTTSDAIVLAVPGVPIDYYAPGGRAFAIQTHNADGESGNGSWTFTYETSIYGEQFSTPSAAGNIATGHTRTSGAGSDGVESYSFAPVACIQIRFVATLDSGTPNKGLNIDLVIWQ